MSKFHQLRGLFGRAGALETGVFLGLTAAQRLLHLRILQIVAITPGRLCRDFLDLDARFSAGFAGRDWLLDQAADHRELEMDPAFVRDALDRGDRCYVITAGRRLASYGWYSSRPTPIFDGLVFRFDPAYTYMYKGFTRPEFRGLRLHAVGMTRALAAIAAEHRDGLVSFVERSNLPSLKSCYRMGYTDVTKIAVLPGHGRHRVLRLGRRPTPEVAVA